MSTNGNGGNGNGGDELLKKGVNETGVAGVGGNVSGGGPAPESEPGSVVAGKAAPPPGKLTKADFSSDQEVRWCPGCGDYAILNSIQKVMPDLGIPREKIVFVSGIGCSSRFPYYMNTYGFHSIHGRAPAVATGIKASNPDLTVWVVTGDGDGLSIGGNHFMHAIRRNLDLNIILFNNRIYGLTKGQYSPTSEFGKKTKSTPMGVIDYPVTPLSLAIASEATFVARAIDIDVKHLSSMVEAAARHKGVSFIEVYQNCNIFNDGAFDSFTERSVRSERVLYLEHGKPMVFGKNRDRGIRMNGTRPEVVQLGSETGLNENDCLVHDAQILDPSVAFMLGRMEQPEFPQPVGIFRDVRRETYEDMMAQQIEDAVARQGRGQLHKLIHSGDMWVVE
ncbi:MAG: 2-oxoacid:ferredoxin oxidoreductase subunit beta [Acidobacteria bacterium]|nr:2-oxoacid:ferredoxin oxidoreductase subunit beta [Acidobacteriota bacterium]